MAEFESDSDSEDLINGSWSLHKRKKLVKSNTNESKPVCPTVKDDALDVRFSKFEGLKAKSSEIMLKSSNCRKRTEIKRSQKLLKKALKDPWIKAAVEGDIPDCSQSDNNHSIKWQDVKPYLTVNDHLQGPVSHGSCGPKTELECMIEDCIEKGDFEQAELLSDTLADREFAVKIDKAFKAKRRSEELEKEKMIEKLNQKKKIRWTFDPKERWQMKGNM